MHIDLTPENRDKVLAVAGRTGMSCNQVLNIFLSSTELVSLEQRTELKVLLPAKDLPLDLRSRRLKKTVWLYAAEGGSAGAAAAAPGERIPVKSDSAPPPRSPAIVRRSRRSRSEIGKAQ
jgi:hypothetical protein